MRSPVFVVGSPRSGTSALVDGLLSIGYHGYREGSFLSVMEPISDAVDRHFQIYGHDAEALVGHVDAKSLKLRIAAVIAAQQSAMNQDPWFDKTGNPAMVLALPYFTPVWPDAAIIFAKRRGIENIVSRMVKFPDHGFEFHCRDWAANMSTWRAVRSKLPNGSFIEVEQQDMFYQPGKVARGLGRLLRLTPASQRLLETALRDTRAQETAHGTAARRLSLESTGWSRPMTETFRELCGTEMAAFGYTMDEAYRTT